MIIAVAALPLGGCTLGASSFGTDTLTTASIAPQDDVSGEGALVQARAHFRNNDYGHSTTYYKKAVEMLPNEAEAYAGLAASYDQLGRFDLSDRVYAALYKLTGGTAQYYNNVGYSYMLRGDLKAALVNFRKASAIDPDNIVVANNVKLLSDAVARV